MSRASSRARQRRHRPSNWNYRRPLDRRLLGRNLVLISPRCLGLVRRRSDRGFNFCKFLVFGQKANTGVDGIGTSKFGYRHDGVYRGRSLRWWWADANRLVSQTGVHGTRRRSNALRRSQSPSRAQPGSAQRDLTPVCNDDFVDLYHQSETTYANSIRGWPNSTGSPSATRTRRTMPDWVLGRWFMTFIASMIIRVSPSLISSPTLTKLPAPGSGAR